MTKNKWKAIFWLAHDVVRTVAWCLVILICINIFLYLVT